MCELTYLTFLRHGGLRFAPIRRTSSVVIASEAKQSRARKKVWIASSLTLLAMTILMIGSTIGEEGFGPVVQNGFAILSRGLPRNDG